MQSILKPSLILVALVSLVSIVIYATGFHKNFMAGQMVFLALAIAINVAVVVWSLGQSGDTNTYGQQVSKAAGIGVLSGALIVLTSWLLLSVVFPERSARSSGKRRSPIWTAPTCRRSRSMLRCRRSTTPRPMSQAVPGGVGAFFTSLVSGAVFAFFRRKK